MKKLFCIGDSHVSVFLGKDRLAPLYPKREKSILKNVEVVRLEGILAYNLCEFNRTTKGREKFEYLLKRDITEHSWILVSAGEVDIRVHLIKQAERQGKTYEEIVNNLCHRYLGYLDALKNSYQILVLLPPPSSYLSEDKIDPQYPRYGDEIQRNKITSLLNKSLKDQCSVRNIPYIEIFEKASTPEGYTKKEFLWDGVHLSTYAFPHLINQINNKTDLEIRIPFTWWGKEWIRKWKRIVHKKIFCNDFTVVS